MQVWALHIFHCDSTVFLHPSEVLSKTFMAGVITSCFFIITTLEFYINEVFV